MLGHSLVSGLYRENTMTDRKDALIKLLAKVEAGDWCTKLALKALPESHVNNSHEWIDPIGWASRALHNGSLDAAKALHEAVSPGWHINLTLDFCSVFPDGNDGEQLAHTGQCDTNPARAWLIAILKALIAEDVSLERAALGDGA
jgi:hypothetical protein